MKKKVTKIQEKKICYAMCDNHYLNIQEKNSPYLLLVEFLT